jgi:energy-coupling factor transporter ATP-binding protein EcfA2
MSVLSPTALADGLASLGRCLRALKLDLEAPGAGEARRVRAEVVAQIDDYLLPRLRSMDAPLLMVVGGSTGAGKSTLVNSLVGALVSPAGVLRPTTRAPVLVCHPDDLVWFEDDRILPGMSRTTGRAAGLGGLELAPTAALPQGVALLDSPDIDSVVDANRSLARQLLAAADAWLFVTTAARYADAVPWQLLQTAHDRGTALSLVLDRVPAAGAREVADHLRAMMREEGLEGAELLVVPETRLEHERLPAAALAPVRDWLDGLAADAHARAEVVRRTLTGALDSLPRRVGVVERALADQQATAAGLTADIDGAYGRAVAEIVDALKSGTLLRGEVLARWHEVVGTGDLMRGLESRLSWMRDRVRSVFTGGLRPETGLQEAVRSNVDAVVHAAADRAAERAAEEWRARPAGRDLLEGAARIDAASPALLDRTREEVRAWQGDVFELVRREAGNRRTTARFASLGVNGAGLVVMLAVFAQTGGLTGAEVLVAGGTTAAGQRLLEALLGDQAVRSLAARARDMLLERTRRLLDDEAERFHARLRPAAPDPQAAARLRDALRSVESAR